MVARLRWCLIGLSGLLTTAWKHKKILRRTRAKVTIASASTPPTDQDTYVTAKRDTKAIPTFKIPTAVKILMNAKILIITLVTENAITNLAILIVSAVRVAEEMQLFLEDVGRTSYL